VDKPCYSISLMSPEPNNSSVQRELLDSKVDVNTRNSDNETALYIACKAGQWAIVEALLEENGIDVDVATVSRGDTALVAAAWNLHANTAKEILSRGVNVTGLNRHNREGLTTLMAVCYASVKEGQAADQKELVKLLVENGADVNASNKTGATPLKFACWRRNAVVAEMLKQYGADPKTQCQASESKKCSSICGRNPKKQTPGH